MFLIHTNPLTRTQLEIPQLRSVKSGVTLESMTQFTEQERRADRMRGMVWGQFLGDAAALGSHWIYNLTELKEKFPNGVEGFESPGKGHYHWGKVSGDLTHYGDTALILLESLAENGGFDQRAYGSRFLEGMAPGKYSGYLDSATRGTYENFLDFQGGSSTKGADYHFQNLWGQSSHHDKLIAPVTARRLVCGVKRDQKLERRVGELDQLF